MGDDDEDEDDEGGEEDADGSDTGDVEGASSPAAEQETEEEEEGVEGKDALWKLLNGMIAGEHASVAPAEEDSAGEVAPERNKDVPWEKNQTRGKWIVRAAHAGYADT